MSAHGAAASDDGARIEALLAELHASCERETVARVDELVERLVGLYGGALSRIMAAVGADVRDALAADDLVSTLLVLHGLHPHGVAARVEAALSRSRPYLEAHAGGVTLVGVDERGVARIRLSGTCTGCSSKSATVRDLLARAVREAAPEIVDVVVEDEDAHGALVQIGRRP